MCVHRCSLHQRASAASAKRVNTMQKKTTGCRNSFCGVKQTFYIAWSSQLYPSMHHCLSLVRLCAMTVSIDIRYKPLLACAHECKPNLVVLWPMGQSNNALRLTDSNNFGLLYCIHIMGSYGSCVALEPMPNSAHVHHCKCKCTLWVHPGFEQPIFSHLTAADLGQFWDRLSLLAPIPLKPEGAIGFLSVCLSVCLSIRFSALFPVVLWKYWLEIFVQDLWWVDHTFRSHCCLFSNKSTIVHWKTISSELA